MRLRTGMPLAAMAPCCCGGEQARRNRQKDLELRRSLPPPKNSQHPPLVLAGGGRGEARTWGGAGAPCLQRSARAAVRGARCSHAPSAALWRASTPVGCHRRHALCLRRLAALVCRCRCGCPWFCTRAELAWWPSLALTTMRAGSRALGAEQAPRSCS